jgi:sugar diacid utilization regulator
MNERIEKLAEEAGLDVYPISITGSTEELEKFAELIVRECAELAWRYTPDTEELEYSHLIKDKILKRFGVEE